MTSPKAVLALALTLALGVLVPASATDQQRVGDVRPVVLVGNNWDGTVHVVDPKRFTRLARIDVVPDLQERRTEIFRDPVGLGLFLGIRGLIGEGHDQFVDDVYTSRDGRLLFASRPSLADVVGIDLRTRRIVWRTRVDGYRSDHMAISPDGRRLLVSASTERKVHSIDPATGRILGEFESGDQPHEIHYSHDGSLVYHASIGSVYTPADQPALDATKGDRWFQVVDARTMRVLKRIDVGKALADAGHPGFSSAVRPIALSPDERYAYLQISFFHGFVEFDLQRFRPTRVARLPLGASAEGLPREQYILDSAHHGLAVNGAGTKLCAAGTMSNYAAIVDRESFAYKIIPVGLRPYWSTNNGDGTLCFVAVSGEDRISVISYASAEEIARIRVGDHPQRVRMGAYRSDLLPGDRVAPRLTRLKVVRRRGGGRALRLRASEPVRLSIDVRKARSGGRRFRRVRTVRRRTRAGATRVALGRLPGAGRYRLVVSARDAAGNRAATRRIRFRVRPAR